VVGAGADAAHHALQSFTRGACGQYGGRLLLIFIARDPGKWIGLGVRIGYKL